MNLEPGAHRDGFKPTLSDEQVRQIKAWHEDAYTSDLRDEDITVEYLGCTLVVPPDVFAPAKMSELLGRAVLDEVRESDRVLDMGTGSGVNAILAASKSAQVVAVDINAAAIECARANAVRNGVADRIEFLETDVFSGVNGRFDLVVFDPPFRWFSPRTMLERASTDENYSAMTRFFSEIDEYLAENGRVLIFFGTSGDIDYLKGLIEGAGLTLEQISTQNLEKNRQTVSYFAFRLHR